MFIDSSKFREHFFKKGHSRNISMKLLQNLTSSFREEDFLGIYSCAYSESSPHSPEPCLWMDQNFANKFWERSLMEHFCDMGIRSHLFCCAYKLDLATELTGYALSSSRVIEFIISLSIIGKS